jgi:hypothetical protein
VYTKHTSDTVNPTYSEHKNDTTRTFLSLVGVDPRLPGSSKGTCLVLSTLLLGRKKLVTFTSYSDDADTTRSAVMLCLVLLLRPCMWYLVWSFHGSTHAIALFTYSTRPINGPRHSTSPPGHMWQHCSPHCSVPGQDKIDISLYCVPTPFLLLNTV